MTKKEVLKKIKDVENTEKKLIDTSIKEIKQSITAESEFEKNIQDFEKELSKIEKLQAESTSRHLFGGEVANQIQMTDAEKKKIEKEVMGNDPEKADYVLEKNKLNELKKELTDLEDYLSKGLKTLPEPETKTKKSNDLSLKKPKSSFDAPKAPSIPTPKKPKSSFDAPKAPSMPAPKKPK